MIHDYYQVANGVFLVAGAAFLLSGLIAINRPWSAALALMCIIIGSQTRFFLHHWPLTAGVTRHPSYVAGTLVNRATDPHSSMIVFGVDWSSEIHYYAQRKGVALPSWSSIEKTKRLLDAPDQWMGGHRLASVVDCRRPYTMPPKVADMKLQQLPEHQVVEVDRIIKQFLGDWTKDARLISDESNQNCLVYVK